MKQRATVVCRHADHILFVTHNYARWSLPGGKLRRGESAHNAARRELEEETRLVACDLTWLFEFRGRSTVHQVFDAIIPPDVVPHAACEIVGCQWIAACRIASLPTSIATQGIVQLLERSGGAMSWPRSMDSRGTDNFCEIQEMGRE